LADGGARAYVLELVASALRFEVLLNGWPAIRGATSRGTTSTVRLNPFIIDGDNELLLRLAPHPDPEHQRRLSLRLASVPEGHERSEEHEILRYRWTKESPLADHEPTSVLQHVMRVDAAFGRWSWQEAIPYRDGDRPAVQGLVDELHRAMSDAKVDDVVRLFEVKTEELGRAVGRTPDEAREATRALVEYFVRNPDWKMAPFDPAKLVIRPEADGRLVALSSEESIGALQGSGPMPLEMDLVVSNLAGRWTIVR
jgi:hypothetical protein